MAASMDASADKLAEVRREIAEALLTIGGVGFRPDDPVTFKSGIQSPVYCDNRRFPFWPAEWRKVIGGFATMIGETPIAAEIIAGVEAAGIPHSAALGYATQTPSIFVRKEAKGHGTKKRVEGGDVTGKRVVLVEDLVTTGMSSMAAIHALREEGAVVTDCLAIISYNFREGVELFAREGVTLHAATTFEVVLEVARERGVLDAAGIATVEDWLRDPWGWATRRNL